MSFMDKIAAAAAQTDMNEVVAGGGSIELPAAGPCRLRLVQYIELGVHAETFEGVTKNKEMVYLGWELSGPKHPVANEETGRTAPFTIGFAIPLSQNEKATFYKLFKRLNADGKATHMAQFLGQGEGIDCAGFIGTVVHVTKGEGADKKTYANLRDADGLTIRTPFLQDPETGDMVAVKVAPAVGKISCFLWAFADKEMWDALFIDGKWDDKKDSAGKVIKEGTSKNYWQNRIMSAINFAGSPAGALVAGGGDEPDLPDAETPAKADAKGAAADPLAGV